MHTTEDKGAKTAVYLQQGLERRLEIERDRSFAGTIPGKAIHEEYCACGVMGLFCGDTTVLPATTHWRYWWASPRGCGTSCDASAL